VAARGQHHQIGSLLLGQFVDHVAWFSQLSEALHCLAGQELADKLSQPGFFHGMCLGLQVGIADLQFALWTAHNGTHRLCALYDLVQRRVGVNRR
jgi:hypothetical protein